MELTHTFTVPTSLTRTWAALNDIESVAGCFPGATVTEADGDSFSGSCKVKLGPIALVYNGSGEFVARDEEAGTMRIEAKGKDKRGNGTAGADVTARLTAAGGDSTTVEVRTDLSVTGKPAQFGRGMMQDVSDKLLAQFVECLQGMVGEPESEPASGTPTSEPAASGPAASEPAAARPTAPTAGAVGAGARGQHTDTLDLGATVLPVLARSYGPRLAAGVVGVVLFFLVRRLVRRRH